MGECTCELRLASPCRTPDAPLTDRARRRPFDRLQVVGAAKRPTLLQPHHRRRHGAPQTEARPATIAGCERLPAPAITRCCHFSSLELYRRSKAEDQELRPAD